MKMRKKLDIIWEKSTLWESVEKWVVKYLKENHAEYQEMRMQSMHLVEDTPALWKLMNDSDGVTLDSEDHETLRKYFEIENGRQTFELEYYFFAGQMMAFSYGNMLVQLKKELLGEKSETSSHLIELIMGIRSDALEKQLQEESEEYQECIREEAESEAELKKLNLSSKECKLVDRYVTAVNNRWLCCGDYLY
jgi:hypothetical protein